MEVRPANDDDWPAIWPIWQRVVAAGDTYVWAPGTTEAEARRLWVPGPPAETFVLVDDGQVAATALLRPVAPGQGAHVANAGFMVDPGARGRGVGRALAEAVIERARTSGYLAMQFNAVVATNTSALALWRSLGFEVVGTVPEAFRHPTAGLVDLHVMHRRL